MKNLIIAHLLVMLAFSCGNNSTENDQKLPLPLKQKIYEGDTTYLGPLSDSILSNGIFFGYVRYDSIVRVELRYKNETLALPIEYEEQFIHEIPECNLYRLQWFNDSIIVLSKGCGMPPNVDSKVISFKNDSFNMFSTDRVLSIEEEYETILVFNEENDYPIHIVSLKNGQIIDRLGLEPILLKLGANEAYFLDNFEYLKGTGKYELFRMNRDTVFFKVNGEEKFLTYKKG